jgi:hypothetical protein
MKSLVLLSALALGPLPSPARAGPAELTAAQAAAARAGAGIVAYRRPWFLADRHLWIWTTSPPAARTPPRGGGAGRGDGPETRP